MVASHGRRIVAELELEVEVEVGVAIFLKLLFNQ